MDQYELSEKTNRHAAVECVNPNTLIVQPLTSVCFCPRVKDQMPLLTP